MRVVLVCPFPVGSRLGNRITAERWRALLAGLGHDVHVTAGVPRAPYDVLVALHARRSAGAVLASRTAHPGRPVVVALTGTDLHHDIRVHAGARRSLALADRLVVLYEGARRELPGDVRFKVRVIRQSAEPVAPRPARSGATFDVAFVAHLRPEKDPLRAARAARLLPDGSRVRVVHVGRALSDAWRRRAEREGSSNPRYAWVGEWAPLRARRLIASARLLVLTSVTEGGANVLGEAIVSGTPVVASRIPAAVSALGGGYLGFFPVGDTEALARLLSRAEGDRRYLAALTRQVLARRHLFAPKVERAAWRALLAELPRA